VAICYIFGHLEYFPRFGMLSQENLATLLLLPPGATKKPFFCGKLDFRAKSRVSRWYIFIPKIPIWIYIGGPWNVKCWCILWPPGIFRAIFGIHIFWPFGRIYIYLVDFIAIWKILRPFDRFYGHLVYIAAGST
jgi:hypothetical protein